MNSSCGGAFAIFHVAPLGFSRRILNRSEDKLEARVKDSTSRSGTICDEQTLGDANSQGFHADMSNLAEKTETNFHDLRQKLHSCIRITLII